MNLHEAATTLVSYILQSGLLLFVGLFLPRILRLRHPRTLLIYWRVLLVVVLLLPLAPLEWAPRAAVPYVTLGGLQVEAAVEKSQGEKPKDSDAKLKAVSSESICDEITHPVVVEKVNPTYPPDAREEKVMGMVIVETVITEEGMVDEIQVLESPDERLSAAAVEAIRQWRFEPALCDGRPVGVYYNLRSISDSNNHREDTKNRPFGRPRGLLFHWLPARTIVI